MRPRNMVVAAFPDGVVTPDEASEALRLCNGNVDAAKARIAAKVASTTSSAPLTAKPKHTTAKKTAALRPLTATIPERMPPKTVVSVNNLSDRQYCCVWHVEVFQAGYRPEVAQALLARVARHVNPILRERGWRVKRLMESTSKSWIGLCTTNGRDDADAASANIQLNLRRTPHKGCTSFRSFESVLSVMLHEITHISIGLEDIHPPAFFELLDEIRQQYYEKLSTGEVAAETDDYGCKNVVVTKDGQLKTVEDAAKDVIAPDNQLGVLNEESQCGARKKRRRRRFNGRKRSAGSKGYQSNVPKRRPLLKGVKMIDGRTKEGKAAKKLREDCTPQELAARAALARFGQTGAEESDSSSSDEEEISPHSTTCVCRSCSWDNLFTTSLVS